MNGRSPAARGRAESPGSSSRISPAASASRPTDLASFSAGRGAGRYPGARRGIEEFARIDRAFAAAQLEMELRLADPTGRTDLGDHLAAVHRVALLDEQLVAMGIGRDPAIGMLDQHQIAVAAQLVAGIGDDAAFDGLDRGTARRCDLDAVIVRAVSRDPAARQP